MKKLLKIAVTLAIIGVLSAIYVWFYVYNKSHPNYQTAEVDFTLPAQSCYNQYANRKDEAINYTGKVLQIDGIPSSIEKTDSTVIIVFVYGNGMFGDEGIRCSLLPYYLDKVQEINLKKQVVVKGYCAGYNGTDVILEYCSLITQ